MAANERYDRAYLLHGAKRNEVLTLDEVRRYGADSFSNDDYLSLYGMTPAEWHARGIRLLGRTAVECTRDVLADRIGRDVGAAAASLPKGTPVTVIDPFAGSCNTLYWILRHVPSSQGLAFELDPQVFAPVATSPPWIGALALSTATSSPASMGASCPQGMR